MRSQPGTVYLVGAGPGDPGLITVAGVQCLERADVVIYDYLVNVRLLDHCPPQAERLLVGKHGGGERVEQSVINELLVEHARRGRQVVRLKGGDPFLFGRGGEEAEVLSRAGIPFEVVPGVTSALAVPAYAGIPLTHRELASSVTICTGYEYPDKPEMAVHWDAVARRGGTLVLLMTTRQLRRNMQRLKDAGMAADTPVAVIRWGTRAEQRTVTGTVSDIADRCARAGIGPPALAVVGDVVRLRRRLAWRERKPLFGRRIVVTRPRRQAAAFIRRLEAAGAEVVPCPVIRIVEPESWEPLDSALARLDSFDWVVFTSTNGVEMFFERLRALGGDVRRLYRARIAAVGSRTAEALGDRGLRADIVPAEFRAEEVARAMIEQGVEGARVLLPRAAEAREVLPRMLEEAGGVVEEVPAYRAVQERVDVEPVRQMLREGRVDLITFTSSSTVRHFLALLGPEAVALSRSARIGCIGPITAETARAAGLEVHVQPSEYTVTAFADAIIAALGQGASMPEDREGGEEVR